MTLALQHFRVDTAQDDRITIWIDVAGRSVNVLFEAVFDELHLVMDQLSRFNSSRPLLFRSAKQKGFVVGADLRRILAIDSDAEIQEFLFRGQAALMRIELYPGETIAYINGPCLGGGLEFAMACGHRIASDSASTQFGMPETKLGLMPGWGGTQRLVELTGISEGLDMLIGGEPIGCHRALEIHLVDAKVQAVALEQELSEFLNRLKIGKVTTSRIQECRTASQNREAYNAWCVSHGQELSKSQWAICTAVELGISDSRVAGFRAERELFFPLLSSPSVREALQRFAGTSTKRLEG